MGSVTQANMRLSIVNGTAFADFSAANSLTPYINQQLTITDSSGKTLVGYISTAGSGETYGSELLPNTAFNDTTNITANNSALLSVAGGQSGNYLRVTPTSNFGSGQENFNGVNGALNLFSGYQQQGTTGGGGDFAIWMGVTPFTTLNSSAFAGPVSWTQTSFYCTFNSVANFLFMTGPTVASGNTEFDTVSTKQVLTPSTTGVIITSTPGGIVQNWASEQSGFNRNDASGYTYNIVSVSNSTSAYRDFVNKRGTDDTPPKYW